MRLTRWIQSSRLDLSCPTCLFFGNFFFFCGDVHPYWTRQAHFLTEPHICETRLASSTLAELASPQSASRSLHLCARAPCLAKPSLYPLHFYPSFDTLSLCLYFDIAASSPSAPFCPPLLLQPTLAINNTNYRQGSLKPETRLIKNKLAWPAFFLSFWPCVRLVRVTLPLVVPGQSLSEGILPRSLLLINRAAPVRWPSRKSASRFNRLWSEMPETMTTMAGRSAALVAPKTTTARAPSCFLAALHSAHPSRIPVVQVPYEWPSGGSRQSATRLALSGKKLGSEEKSCEHYCWTSCGQQREKEKAHLASEDGKRHWWTRVEKWPLKRSLIAILKLRKPVLLATSSTCPLKRHQQSQDKMTGSQTGFRRVRASSGCACAECLMYGVDIYHGV